MERDGWQLSAIREAGALTLCALERSFAGNDQLAAGVVIAGGEPLWLREVCAGDFMYLYGVDRMLVVHNVSLTVASEAWAFRDDSGAPLLRVVRAPVDLGRPSEVRLELFGEDGRVRLATEV